ncbi:MAG: hypothetical protein AB8F34_00530 [Akkermansiaceae bacterium]
MAILYFGVYLLSAVSPNMGMLIDFDFKRIIAGEVWRVVTFVFATHAVGFSPIGLLFCFFGMMLTFIFSDGLESQWGVFRTNLYVFAGYFLALIGAFMLGWLFDYKPTLPGIYIGMSVMFAFATYNPRFTLMLFLIIPTPIWLIASITGFFVGLGVLFGFLGGDNAGSIFTLMALANYLVVAVPMRLNQSRMQRGTVARRREFQASAVPDDDAFHRCKVCGATDVSHPNYEFRVGKDGEDYCMEHLPK